jgi:hypothetical protein
MKVSTKPEQDHKAVIRSTAILMPVERLQATAISHFQNNGLKSIE